jgi:uncharacterized protein
MSVKGALMTPDAAPSWNASPADAQPPPPGSEAGAWIPYMVDRIVREFRPVKVILFGSQARGDAGTESDVDLLVVMPDTWAGARKRTAAVGIMGALSDLPISKDIVITTPEEIARRGRLVGTVLQLALAEGTVLYEQR